MFFSARSLRPLRLRGRDLARTSSPQRRRGRRERAEKELEQDPFSSKINDFNTRVLQEALKLLVVSHHPQSGCTSPAGMLSRDNDKLKHIGQILFSTFKVCSLSQKVA
jgi:hypothetical protein